MRKGSKAPGPSPAGYLLVFLCAWALGGCGLLWNRTTVGRPTAQQQAQYARAEARLSSADADVRRQAAVSLLSMTHPDAVQAVVSRMGPAFPADVRISMIRAVAFLRDRRCFGRLLEAVQDRDEQVRTAAADALARFTHPEDVEAMVARAEQSGPEARRLIYRALGEGLAVSAVPALVRGLASGDEQVRIAAWEALKQISGRDFPLEQEPWRKWAEANSQKTREDVLEERLEAMRSRLASRSEELRALAEQQDELMRLVQSSQSETPQELLGALSSRYEVVRQYAASRLAGLSDEQLRSVSIDDSNTYTMLNDALDDPSEEVRRNVLRFVLRVGGDYRPRLVNKALYDTSPAVLVLAINALEGDVDASVVSRLEQLLAEPPQAEVREAAANVLGRIGSADAVPALMKALDDPADNVRWFAVEGLRKLGAVQAVPRISEMLQKDRSAHVREVAASALGELGQPAGVPALRMALDDQNERVRQKAVAALLTLASGDYERMMVIAGAFREKGLHSEARTVLSEVIKTYSGQAEMRSRLIDAYNVLAEVESEQQDHAAAASTYQELDALVGGSPEVRRKVVNAYLDAAEPARVVDAVEGWFVAAGVAKDRALLELALDAAERLAAAGCRTEADAVLKMVQEAAADHPELNDRIQQLQQGGTP